MKKFAKSHEWISIEGEIGTVGITNYAQEHLGDIVYVELPEIGKTVSKEEVVCTVESVKAASDIYAPVSGEIVEINEELDTTPELINQDAEGEGWLFKIKLSNSDELNELMDEEEYKAFCKEEE
ncbi:MULTISPECIES: glycine cleavage system protein GcvH [Kosmotoga]|jgi:glycine cleavage system H protein|uniref:Glycine cleavage system H protein n=1 Tax=Kosmotoga olearia (strain ATCC BAA-1733 / DSM 21960 / TBF 19.5.1) TaxID=521045 RepID=C5CF46_KOSOT|nr:MULTISPECIES: glycine cleavage system protein GcvH [Kosmotoga]ACR80311.1 glycine cleavage system H protein [Kosmotoga olearia TBF 19.5.1]MDI3523558.1 glycine cleavage system protein [Kosmotoga sp.]MDK2953042.1 glycine cleavage system protein [Kosmotoga sp.]OAA20243.1 glycine cleavage system protein H [Kosmotoga sp. DU53]